MLYLEDLHAGRRFISATHTLSQEEIIAYAREFDPQPFHTDPEAARATVFQGLAASGWHTCSISMRLFVQSELSQVAGGLVGMQVDKLHWTQPTRPGDTLRVEVEVLGARHSSSKPGFGVVQLRWTTINQRDEVVMHLENAIWVPARPA